MGLELENREGLLRRVRGLLDEGSLERALHICEIVLQYTYDPEFQRRRIAILEQLHRLLVPIDLVLAQG